MDVAIIAIEVWKLLAAVASVNIVCIMVCLLSPIVADSLDVFAWLVVLQ